LPTNNGGSNLASHPQKRPSHTDLFASRSSACVKADRRAKWTFDELLFMCWTRETGVIPAALAGLLLGMKAPGAHMIASVTFIAVLMTILIQAPTKKWLAGRLKLLEDR
jgi:cell volume regulation protein A